MTSETELDVVMEIFAIHGADLQSDGVCPEPSRAGLPTFSMPSPGPVLAT